MWASESIIMPTRPLANSSTFSCSRFAKMPGEMSPASCSDLMKVSVSMMVGVSRFGLPSFIMDWPDAQTHDITSFWMPPGF